MKHLVRSCLLTILLAVLMPNIVLAQGATLTPIDDVTTLNHYELVNDVVELSQPEIDLLQQNHFVVSDEDAWLRFVEAYAWIYWKDLPVLITTDSMLHAMHQSYVDLLIDLETNIMKPELLAMFQATRAELAANPPTTADPEALTAYNDLQTYLEVAEALLYVEDEVQYDETVIQLTDNVPPLSPAAQVWFDRVMAANQFVNVGLFGEVVDHNEIPQERRVDMTMFTPRGHYPDNYLSGYFMAMNWLAQIDFRLAHTAYDASTQAFVTTPQPIHIAAATMFQSALDNAGQRERWNMLNEVLITLVGESDNTTLNDLDQFVTDAGLSAPEDVFTADQSTLATLFETNDYGKQRITGQIISVDSAAVAAGEETPLPTSFMVFGTRFVIDSWVMSQVVFDRLRDDVTGDPAYRALPDPNDAMYALGNDRALTHLSSDLATFNYTNTLTGLRQTVDELPGEWWDDPVYNGWLNTIRSLNEPAADGRVPDVMKTDAWADKNLQTQLASWAQLRHDNLLYAKQSFTIDEPSCEFPDWYIEPQVEFYEAMIQYAQMGSLLVERLENAGLDERQLHSIYKVDNYFFNLETVGTKLLDMVERQLNGGTFTYEDEMFIQNIIIKHLYIEGMDYTVKYAERWDGWYADLFYDDDDVAAVIVDVHTNPTNDPSSDLYPPRVLHVATGDVSPIYFVADKGNGPTLYVGPAFSYYEIVTEGDDSTPAQRYTDQDWQPEVNNLGGGGPLAQRSANKSVYRIPKPPAPEWTQSFRVSTNRWVRDDWDVSPSDISTLRAKTTGTIWEFLFGSLEVIPGTINPPTEPSGVRIEASVLAASTAYQGYDGYHGPYGSERHEYSVRFTNEGTVDRDGLTAQLFIDLSELYESGYSVEDMYIQPGLTTCLTSFADPRVWNETEHIYYITIDLRRTTLAIGDQCETTFTVYGVYPSTGESDAELMNMDILNDFSAQGLSSELSETTLISLYEEAVMIDGSLPPFAPSPLLVSLTHAVSNSPELQRHLLTRMIIVGLVATTVVIVGKRVRVGRKLN